MISGPTSEIEDRPWLHRVSSEDFLEKVDVAFVIHERVVDEVVIPGEPPVQRARRPTHGGLNRSRGMMLWLLHDNDRMVRLVRSQNASVEDSDSRGH